MGESTTVGQTGGAEVSCPNKVMLPPGSTLYDHCGIRTFCHCTLPDLLAGVTHKCTYVILPKSGVGVSAVNWLTATVAVSITDCSKGYIRGELCKYDNTWGV